MIILKKLYPLTLGILGICATALIPMNAFAQENSKIITGKAFEKDSNQLLHGVNVSILGTPMGTATNSMGVFEISGLDSNTHEIRFSYLGYRDTTITVNLNSVSSRSIEVWLSPDVLELSEVAVRSENTFDNVNVINQIDIKLRPVDNSQDILRALPGLVTGQHAGGGKAEQIFLRGFDIDHGTDINISVDDMPVNMVSHAHGQGYSDLHFLIPETIQRVDFDKGPYYADKGNFTTAGFAAFTTRRALEKSRLSVEAGQFGTYRGSALFNIFNSHDGKTHAYAAGEYLDKEGYFISGQDFSRINLFGKFSTALKDDLRLSASASHFDSDWRASGQIPQRAVDSGLITKFGAIDDTEGGNTSRSNINAQLDHTVSNHLLLKHQVYVNRYDFLLFSNFTFFMDDPENGDQIRQSEGRNIFGYKGSAYVDGQLGSIPVRSIVGAGFRYDDINDIRLSRTKDRTLTLEKLALGQINELNAFMFLNEDLYITNQLLINAGLRADFFNYQYKDELQLNSPVLDNQHVILSPKLNMEFQFNSDHKMYAKSGIGFHSNDSRAVVAQGGEQILPRAYSFDLGAISKPFDRLIINPAVWILYLEREFVFVGDGGFVEPSGRTKRLGADLSVRYQILDWLYADLDLNYSHARFIDEPEGQNFIPLAPDFTSIAGLTFNLENGLNGSLRYRAVAGRPANEDNSITAEGYIIADAMCNYSFKDFEIGLSIQNLLNSDWKETQFAYESQLAHESASVNDLHFTPGTPFFAKAIFSYSF